MLSFAFQVFMGFFAIMNPFGNIPIFLGLVEDLDEPVKKKIAKKSTITAFVIVFLFSVGGNLIFRLFGITLPAFRIAGGILIFAIAFELLNGKKSRQHHLRDEETDEIEDPTAIAITPLGIPILAGPGTITTAMSFVGNHTHLVNIAIVIAIFFIMCLITYVFFIFSDKILSKLGLSWISLLSRLMGLILAVIAVQMMLEGIRQALPGL
ncbi:MAG: NAAT family transporter [Calditrichaeota bacterium]|nr:NAAT family transporter [Calditrichota bacterium]